MRTTVTLDADVETLLRRQVRQSGQSFKETLNNALRAGLRSKKDRPPFKPITFDMGVPKIDLTKAASVAASLEDDELLMRLRRSR